MSATPHQHAHDHATHQQRREDPTRTKSARRRFAQHLRGRWDAIKSHIRQGLVENDALGERSEPPVQPDIGDLAANVDKDDYLTPGPGDWDRRSDGATQQAFKEWLDEVLQREILDKYDGDVYIRKGAERGIKHADTEMRKAGIDIPDEDVAAALRLPVHQDKLELMFERSFEELEGITQATAQEIRREFAEGLASGANPRDMARNLTDRVEAIGKTRSTVLARTEVIRTHSEFTLDRYEQIAGDVRVTIRAEIRTAGDDRVCPVCQALESQTQEQTLSIDEVRTGSFSFTPDDPDIAPSLRGQFPNQPPIHPQCRCVIIVVGS
jgi:hypothetical protein